MDISVRQATHRDMGLLFELWLACKQEEEATGCTLYPVFNEDNDEELHDWIDRYNRALDNPDARVFIAEVDGTPAGFISAARCYRAFGKPHHFVFLDGMFVEPRFRKSLIAKALMGKMEDWTRELNEEDPANPVGAAELAAAPTETQVKRWIRKGFSPYAVMMKKELK